MPVQLKCGCTVTDDGKFALGGGCQAANCGECRTVAQLHPFGPKRFADLMFSL